MTVAIKARSTELLGYEVKKEELAFMPYLSHLIANNISLNNLSDEEEIVLEELKSKGLVIQSKRLQCTFDYWVAMQENMLHSLYRPFKQINKLQEML